MNDLLGALWVAVPAGTAYAAMTLFTSAVVDLVRRRSRTRSPEGER